MDIANEVSIETNRELQYAHRHIVQFRVLSGLDFEAAGDSVVRYSVVRYFVSNYLLRGLRVVVNMTWRL